MFPNREYVESIRAQFPEGTKIVLDRMGDDPRPVPPGTRGTVAFVDDIGTVFCDFENGRHLGLIPGEDSFHKVSGRARGGGAR